jgi:D-tyrosyl-tRNA(Tyr) deacylase
MRLVIQRVSKASVEVEGKVTGKINQGLLILVGIEDDDTLEDITWLTYKITRMRIFNDKDGKMNLSIDDVDGRALVVSQFTLHASTRKGSRPSYTKAAKPEFARMMYEIFVSQLEKELHTTVQTGIFGADMKVSLINDGPVTIILDSKIKE